MLENEASFVPFAPGQEELIPVKVSLPEGYQQRKDILKVFATVGSAKFRWLELPSLDKPIKSEKTIIR